MTRATFTTTQVADLKAALQAAPPPTSALSMTGVLRELAPTLQELREKGYNAEAIVELLRQHGLGIKLSTFRCVLKKKSPKEV